MTEVAVSDLEAVLARKLCKTTEGLRILDLASDKDVMAITHTGDHGSPWHDFLTCLVDPVRNGIMVVKTEAGVFLGPDDLPGFMGTGTVTLATH